MARYFAAFSLVPSAMHALCSRCLSCWDSVEAVEVICLLRARRGRCTFARKRVTGL
jgi:hypothetical protein